MHSGYLLIISWFIVGVFSTPKSKYLKKGSTDNPTTGKLKDDVKRDASPTALISLLENHSIQYDSEFTALDLTKLKVKDVSGSEFIVYYDGPGRFPFSNLFEFETAVEFNGEITGEENQKSLHLSSPNKNVYLNSEDVYVYSLDMKIGNNNHEANIHLQKTNKWADPGIDINGVLNAFGYNNKETYINMDQIDSAFRVPFSLSEEYQVDLFDTATDIYIRMGSDDNWHVAFIPRKDYFMFVCSHLGKGDIAERNCAVVKKLSNVLDKFVNWAKKYAEDVDFSLLKDNFVEGSTLISSLGLVEYNDRKNPMFMDLLTIESGGVKMPIEIDGGENYYIINIPYETSYGFDLGRFSKVFLRGKLYKTKLEYRFEPEISMSSTNLAKMFAKETKLNKFFSDMEKIHANKIVVEKLELGQQREMCVTTSFKAPLTIIADKYTLNRSSIEFCQSGEQLQIQSNGEEEIHFNAKALMNAEYDEDKDVIKFSGEIFITDTKALFDETASFIPAGYESLEHIKNFPVKKLFHFYTHHKDINYMRFEGDAIFNNEEFTIQVLYWFGSKVHHPIAMCLAFDYEENSNDETSPAQRQDTEEPGNSGDGDEPESSGDGTSNTQQPKIKKPLSLGNITRFILNRKNIEFDDSVKFASLRISFQQDVNIYQRLNLEDDPTYKCGDIVKNIRRNMKPEESVLAPSPPGIFISASRADYGCTKGTEKENALCRFLKKGFGLGEEEQYLPQVYYGYMRLTAMKIMGWFPVNQEFTVNDQFKLRAPNSYADSRYRFGYVHTIGFDDLNENFEGNEIFGYGYMESFLTSFDMRTYIKISGNSVYLSIEPQDPPEPTNIAGVIYVTTNKVYAERHLLNVNSDVKVVFQGDLLIGAGRDIIVGGEDALVEQHIYGNAVKNRLLACPPQGTVLENMKDYISKLGIHLNDDIFNVGLKDICFTYHNGEQELWNVTSKNIIAERGFWLHANTTMDARNKYGETQTFVVSVKMRCDPDNKTLIYSRPPLYFYPIEEERDTGLYQTLEHNTELDYKVVITRTKTSKDKGPDLVISEIPHQLPTTKLKGYVTSIAFEGDVDFKVLVPDYNCVEFLQERLSETTKRQQKKDDEVPLLTKGYQIKGCVVLGEDNLQFSFTGTGLVEQAKKNYTMIVAKKIQFLQDKQNEHKEMDRELTLVTKPISERGSKKGELEKMYMDVQHKKTELYREEKKRYGPCYHCKAVKAPGFVWNSCPISDRLGKVSCLQFKKDALKSCDVQCLARCDISKVDAEESSMKIHKDLIKRAGALEKRSQLTEIYDELNDRLYTPAWAMIHARGTFDPHFRSFKSIQGRAMPLKDFETPWTDFSNFKKYDKLPFTLIYPTRYQYKDEREVVEFPVDGYLPSRMAEYYFEKKHGGSFRGRESEEKDVQKKFGILFGIIDDWKIENQDLLKKEKRGIPIEKKIKRTYDFINIDGQPTSLFHEDDVSTETLMRKRSPWNALKASNPFPLALNSTRNKAKRFKVSKSASFCRNRRNRIRDYKDMIKYMTSWSDSFDQAKTFLQNSKTDIMNGINSLDVELLQKRSLNNGTISKKREEIGKKWINRMKSGFSTWENEFNQQLSSYHSIAPKLMWNEMNAIFTPAEFDSLQSYLRSTPSSALARSIAPDPPIQQIGESFLNGFASMKTLDDNRKLVKQITSMVQKAEQSSQSCHDEL